MQQDNYDNVLTLKKLSCKAGYKYLIRDITWEVKKGEHWIVFGMNGSGKTTLLSIIAGYKHFTSGTVNVLGESFRNDNIIPLRKKIGWVSTSFFDKYYTRESALHIVLSGKCGALGLDESITLEDVLLAKKLLRELGLKNMENRPFDLLSKGERQNILIARALIAKPELLILDEPCTGLDVYNRSYLFHTLELLGMSKELTMIYVTHHVEEILPMFQETLLLKNGCIYSKGATCDAFTDSTMSDFLGYPVRVENDGNRNYRLQVETSSKLLDILG